MRVLVTGGAGFIGNNLIRSLASEPTALPDGEPVGILNLDALTYAASPDALSDLAEKPRYRFAQINLLNAEAVQSAFEDFQPNWVIHLAAESHVDRSIRDPAIFLQSNTVGTFNLLQAARAHFEQLTEGAQSAFRLLHVSTDEVYGSLANDGVFGESSPYAPNSPYSASKAASDHLARAWCATYGLPVIIAHASNNFGPFQNSEKLIPTVIRNALSGSDIPIYGTGLNTRDWIYVKDCVDALRLLVAYGRPGESYNVGASNERTNTELAQKICEILDDLAPRADGRRYAEQIKFVRDRPGHDFRYAIDASKIKREIGWSPQYDFETALHETVQWYRLRGAAE